MKTEDFNYHLPREAIAQTPVTPRHASRLLVYNRASEEIQHATFLHVGDFLSPRDLLVINRTRVIPARIHAHKPTGGLIELLLLKKIDSTSWEVLIGGKRVREGMTLQVVNGPVAIVCADLERPRRVVTFAEPVEPYLSEAGEMPLPPYIHTRLDDPERYQTVYAAEPGSAAAPTAGLHFTPELMTSLKDQGIRFAEITLHVGLDTFAPVTEENPLEHVIHTEWCELDQTAADLINRTKLEGGRIIAVGTTSVRTLETAAGLAGSNKMVVPFSGPTNLFIVPGYTYKAVDVMITNFHLPKSTLLMLVSAFAGREKVLSLYQTALDEGYRFFSFGDAMLIL